MRESWLSANDVKNLPVVSEFEKHGYYFHYRLICSGRGGGVAVLLRNNFKARRCDDFVAKSFQSIELLITTFSCAIRWELVIDIMPPSEANKLTKTLFMKDFKPYLEHLAAQSGILLFTGDFNINWTDSSNYERNQFSRLLSSYNLCQYVTVPTHDNDNDHCIDYIILFY